MDVARLVITLTVALVIAAGTSDLADPAAIADGSAREPANAAFYLVMLYGSANRDPRVFDEPDSFVVGRKDLCQREPRGQYRADGLPSGIAFGMGKPSVHPAVPKERPRSIYAITSDVAVTASTMLLDAFPDMRLTDDAEPTISSLRLGEMHTCWYLPVAI